tara:strand:- start:273 stop:956 length:684 start_codon:yes stop_codon:yes gene_type:complete
MNLKIVFGVFILLFIIYILYLALSPSDGLIATVNANNEQTINADTLMDGSANFEKNRSYSIWIFVNEWSNDSEKNILSEGTGESLDVYLGKDSNDLYVKLNGPDGNVCVIENIALQKWTNIIVTIYNRSADTYLNGKLVNTCSLSTMINGDADRASSMTLAKGGNGFNGKLAKFQYFPYIVNPQKAWDIYSSGFEDSNWLKDLFKSNYSVKFTWMEDGNDEGDFSIP